MTTEGQSTYHPLAPNQRTIAGVNAARDAFVKATRPLTLEMDQEGILEKGQSLVDLYDDYIEQIRKPDAPPTFDQERFDNAYSTLLDALRKGKAELENIR